MNQKSTGARRASRTFRAAVEPTRLDSMQEWLVEALRALPELESRAMFGGNGIYSGSTMFAILHAGRVYLKTNEETCEAFVRRGSAPFQPRKGTVLASYHEVPGEILDDEVEFLAWAQRAVLVARAAPAKSRARSAVPPDEILEGYGEEIRGLADELRRSCAAPRPTPAKPAIAAGG
jgi:DNA transformation protein and related proteins